MRILIVSMVFPLPLKAGGRIRIFNLIKSLSAKYSISLLSFIDSEEELKYLSQLSPYCDQIETVLLRRETIYRIFRILLNIKNVILGIPIEIIIRQSAEMQRKLNSLLEYNEYDIIQFDWIQMAQYFSGVRKKVIGKSILVEYVVSYISQLRTYRASRGFRKFIWLYEYLSMKVYEKRMCSMFSRVVVVSNEDRQNLLRLNQDIDVAIVPNGVDNVYYSSGDVKKEQESLLHSGWLGYHANLDSLKYFLKEILPMIRARKPGMKLYIVGDNVPKEIISLGQKDKYIVVTGYVKDIREYVKKSTILVVPLRIGGGTRLKILEAMAAGTVVVSTSIGCEGLDVNPGDHLLVADTPKEFAESVIRLLEEPTLRNQIEEDAKKLVQEKYDWKTIAHQMEKVYQDLGQATITNN